MALSAGFSGSGASDVGSSVTGAAGTGSIFAVGTLKLVSRDINITKPTKATGWLT